MPRRPITDPKLANQQGCPRAGTFPGEEGDRQGVVITCQPVSSWPKPLAFLCVGLPVLVPSTIGKERGAVTSDTIPGGHGCCRCCRLFLSAAGSCPLVPVSIAAATVVIRKVAIGPARRANLRGNESGSDGSAGLL